MQISFADVWMILIGLGKRSMVIYLCKINMIVCMITSNDIRHDFMLIEEPLTLTFLLWFTKKTVSVEASCTILK
jgi:hypothetical protein